MYKKLYAEEQKLRAYPTHLREAVTGSFCCYMFFAVFYLMSFIHALVSSMFWSIFITII